MEKDLAYYMGLQYRVEYEWVENDPNYPDGYYYGGFPDLQGCRTDAPTVEELLEELEDLKREWLELQLEAGHPISDPSDR